MSHSQRASAPRRHSVSSLLASLAALLGACTPSYGPWNVEDEPAQKEVEQPVCRTGNEPGCAFDNPMCTDPGDAECMGSM